MCTQTAVSYMYAISYNFYSDYIERYSALKAYIDESKKEKKKKIN